MTITEVKDELAEFARSLVPPEYSNLLFVSGDGRSADLFLKNIRSEIADEILAEMRQKSVSCFISRNEELSGMRIVKSFSTERNGAEARFESISAEGLDQQIFFYETRPVLVAMARIMNKAG